MKKIIIILVVIFVYFLSAEKQRIVFCYFGDKAACHNVGYYNETGAENTKINLEKAKKYYEKACRKDFVGSCHNMGLLLNQEKNILASRQYFEKGCDLDYLGSCASLAASYLENEPKDNDRAIKISLKMCNELNEVNACYVLANIYAGVANIIKKDEIDEKRAINYLEKACNLDHNGSCYGLGRIYSDYEKNYEKGNKYYKKACDLNNSSACNSIGFHYENGYGFEVNLKEAYKFYTKACENFKNNYGCGSLGYLYLVAKSADDFSNSPEFYEKSCKFNDGENCANLENFLKNYDFIDRDYNKAKELLEYSCDEKVAQSCGVLGTMYEFGKGASQDIFVAKENYKKACDLGYKLGCDELKRLEND